MSKHILLILTDQQAATATGCYGNPCSHTPNMDSLAATGTRFDCHISNNPVCMPARASIITGRSTAAHRLYRNGFELAEDFLPTFGNLFVQAGYRTTWIGKTHWQCQYDGPHDHEPYYGFEHTELTEDNQIGKYVDWVKQEHPDCFKYVEATLMNLPDKTHPYWEGREYYSEENTRKILPDVLGSRIPFKSSWPEVWVNPLPEEATQTAWIADRAIDAIRTAENDGQPMLTVVSFVGPHNPYNPTQMHLDAIADRSCPPPIQREGEHDLSPPHYRDYLKGEHVHPWIKGMLDMSDEEWQIMRRHYFAKTGQVDHHLGRVLDALRESGLYDDTTILFSSDHGDMAGDHGMAAKSGFPYDSCIRVPMIINDPEHRDKAPCVVEQATSHLDLFPTLLDAAGIECPETLHLDGHSVMPLTRNEKTQHPEFSFSETLDGNDLPRGVEFWPKTLRNNRWRYTYFHGNRYGQLFDLEADPDELNNLWGTEAYRKIEDRLRMTLLDTLVASESPLSKTVLPA